MRRIIDTDFDGLVNELGDFGDGFPLLAAMCEKNVFTGMPCCYVEENGCPRSVAVVDPDGYPLYAKLWVLETEKDCRGKGMGTDLLRHILERFDEVKLCAMRPAFDFYTRNGFAFVSEPDPKSNVCFMVSKA